jgi:excisionase family DNA binding protein
MHNLVLSPIDPEKLISSISERVTASILNAVRIESQASQPDAEVLTVPEAAEFLRLSVQTVYGLISKGQLPVMKRSKRCYFSKAELIAYLKEGRRSTHSEIASNADQYLVKKKKG